MHLSAPDLFIAWYREGELTTVCMWGGTEGPEEHITVAPQALWRSNTAAAFFSQVSLICSAASSLQACQRQYEANWVNATMLVFLKAAGILRKRRLDESPPPITPPPTPTPCCSTVFTKRHSSTFVEDGFINRGGMVKARRDWVWLANPRLSPATCWHSSARRYLCD